MLPVHDPHYFLLHIKDGSCLPLRLSVVPDYVIQDVIYLYIPLMIPLFLLSRYLRRSLFSLIPLLSFSINLRYFFPVNNSTRNFVSIFKWSTRSLTHLSGHRRSVKFKVQKRGDLVIKMNP